MTKLPDDQEKLFNKNILALESVHDTLGNIHWPADLEFLRAVDGAQTACSKSFSKSGWFAGSSSPLVRGKIMAEKFSAGEVNILLPGTGQGETIRILLESIKTHQSIFVWDPETINIAILFCLHDFSKAIKDKQLIFLKGNNLDEVLIEYFAANEELSVPTKMLSWPWISETHMQGLSLQIERAIDAINSSVSERISELQLEFENRWKTRQTEKLRRVLIVSLSSSPQTHSLARNIASSSENSKLDTHLYLLDTPLHTSNVSLLREINDFDPEIIISIALSKSHWPIKPPDSVPFISFLAAPSVRMNREQLDTIQSGKNEIFVLGDSEDAEYLRGTIPTEKVLAFEIAVNTDEFKPLNNEPEYDLIIHADISDTDPENYGISQKSHQSLWKQVESLISKSPLRYSESRADDLLGQAGRLCGVKLSDPELFKSFCELVKKYLAPATVAKRIIEKLSESEFKSRVVAASEITTNKLLNSAGMILILSSETNFRQILFDSLSSGLIVILKKNDGDRLESFREIESACVYLEANKDILMQIKNVTKNRAELKARVERAGRYISENHSYTSVLQRLLEAAAGR